MAGTNSIVGSGSLMPQDFYLKKMEMTCVFEDPELLNNYYRQSLKDAVGPDAPFFESDQPRRNNFSETRLNMRHCGGRSEKTPFLPDGTFLDFMMMDKDPRGTAVGPDMKQHRKQQEARGKFIKKVNDEDHSVPSAGWHPINLVKAVRNSLPSLKSRMKIFEESMNGRHNGGHVIKLSTKARCMQESDAKTCGVRDEICYNRSNYVNELSNKHNIGWTRTTDHRFKIAKYGHVRCAAPASAQNWSKNRANSRVEHDVALSWKEQNIPKSVALKMIDLSRRKETGMQSGETVAWGNSEKNANKKSKLAPGDLNQITRQSKYTHHTSAHSMLNGEQSSHVSGKQMLHKYDNNKMGKSVIDPHVIEFITSFNRKMSPREIDDLREQILQSDEYKGILVEQNNTANSQSEINNELLWESVINHEKNNSLKVANYAQLSGDKIAPKNKSCYNFDQLAEDQKINCQRRGNMFNELYNYEAVDYDNDYGLETARAQHVGGLGTKYLRTSMDVGDTCYKDMADILASN